MFVTVSCATAYRAGPSVTGLWGQFAKTPMSNTPTGTSGNSCDEQRVYTRYLKYAIWPRGSYIPGCPEMVGSRGASRFPCLKANLKCQPPYPCQQPYKAIYSMFLPVHYPSYGHCVAVCITSDPLPFRWRMRVRMR